MRRGEIGDVSELQGFAAEIQAAITQRDQQYGSTGAYDTARQAVTAAGVQNVDFWTGNEGQDLFGFSFSSGTLFENLRYALNDSIDYLSNVPNPDDTGITGIETGMTTWRANRDQFFSLMGQLADQDLQEAVLYDAWDQHSAAYQQQIAAALAAGDQASADQISAQASAEGQQVNAQGDAINTVQTQIRQEIGVLLSAPQLFQSIRKPWQLDIVTPDYDDQGDWTGGFIPVDHYGASSYIPSVTLQASYDTSAGDGTITVYISGLVGDAAADIVEGNQADITKMHIFVNGLETDDSPVPVSRIPDTVTTLRPYAFTGEYSATVTFPPDDGENVIRVVTEQNAVSKFGSADLLLNVSNPDSFPSAVGSALLFSNRLPLSITPSDSTRNPASMHVVMSGFAPADFSLSPGATNTYVGSVMPYESVGPLDQTTIQITTMPARDPTTRDFMTAVITTSYGNIISQPIVLCETGLDTWEFQTASAGFSVNGPDPLSRSPLHLWFSNATPGARGAIGLYQGIAVPPNGYSTLTETGVGTGVFQGTDPNVGNVEVELSVYTGFTGPSQNQIGVRFSSSTLNISAEPLILFETAAGSLDFATIVRNIVPGLPMDVNGLPPAPSVDSMTTLTSEYTGRFQPLFVRLQGQVDLTQTISVNGIDFDIVEIGQDYFADGVLGVFGGGPVVKPSKNIFDFPSDGKLVAKYQTNYAVRPGSDVIRIDLDIGPSSANFPDNLLVRSLSSKTTNPANPRCLARVLIGEPLYFSATNFVGGPFTVRYLLVDRSQVPLVGPPNDSWLEAAKVPDPPGGPAMGGAGSAWSVTLSKPGRYSVIFYIDFQGSGKHSYFNDPTEWFDITVHERRDIALLFAQGPPANVGKLAPYEDELRPAIIKTFDEYSKANDMLANLQAGATTNTDAIYLHFSENPGNIPIGGIVTLSTTSATFLSALAKPGAYVMVSGHSNLGLGPSFGTNGTPETPKDGTFKPIKMCHKLVPVVWSDLDSDEYLDDNGSRLTKDTAGTIHASDVKGQDIPPEYIQLYKLDVTKTYAYDANAKVHTGAMAGTSKLTFYDRDDSDLSNTTATFKLLYVQTCYSDYYFAEALTRANPTGALLLTTEASARFKSIVLLFVSDIHKGKTPAELAADLDAAETIPGSKDSAAGKIRVRP